MTTYITDEQWDSVQRATALYEKLEPITQYSTQADIEAFFRDNHGTFIEFLAINQDSKNEIVWLLANGDETTEQTPEQVQMFTNNFWNAFTNTPAARTISMKDYFLTYSDTGIVEAAENLMSLSISGNDSYTSSDDMTD